MPKKRSWPASSQIDQPKSVVGEEIPVAAVYVHSDLAIHSSLFG